MRPAAFLDRDGTIVHDTGYLSRIEDLRWFPFAIDAIRLLNRAGWLVFVTTNQGGIGLGLYEESFVVKTHTLMAAEMARGGAHVDGWFYCPHHPRAVIERLRVECDCRKPRLGMILAAEARAAIDRRRSVVVGDKRADVQMGVDAGATGILVRTGQGEAELARAGAARPAHVVADLMAATAWMLGARATGDPSS